ncbi:unnamed protein product [Prorocentrum cordatum]|uniref:Uncharacterized protein n=1 Tax=Prorocentrum cordatum TaxID=2364126 RepID=A0ABN9SJT5_9DINO|nr:unnamed protein product [Polarella glacialis]
MTSSSSLSSPNARSCVALGRGQRRRPPAGAMRTERGAREGPGEAAPWQRPGRNACTWNMRSGHQALLRLPIKLVDDGWKALRQHHPHQPHPPTRPSDASGWVASRLMESRPACVQHNTVLPKRLPTACASRCRVEPRSSCAPRDRIRLARGGDVHEEAEARKNGSRFWASGPSKVT